MPTNFALSFYVDTVIRYKLHFPIYFCYSWPPHRFAADLRGSDLPPVVGRLQDGRQRDPARRRPSHRRESGLGWEGKDLG